MQRYISSVAPRSTTLVSPPTISTPATVAASAIACTSAHRTSELSPSSRIIDTVSATGRAPETDRSLTVPLTASSPIDPPGNRSGLTTKLSVVSATRAPSSAIVPASPRAASVRVPERSDGAVNAGTSNPSMSVCVALPPAPWASVTCSSRNLGRLAHSGGRRGADAGLRLSHFHGPPLLCRFPGASGPARTPKD